MRILTITITFFNENVNDNDNENRFGFRIATSFSRFARDPFGVQDPRFKIQVKR